MTDKNQVCIKVGFKKPSFFRFLKPKKHPKPSLGFLGFLNFYQNNYNLLLPFSLLYYY